MAWVKVPPEHHPIFRAALPEDPRVETLNMFGGVAAKARGHLFAGLFGRSFILSLDEKDLAEALALEGAGYFDPMGDGRRMSDKVMMPESLMEEPDEMARWIRRAFETALARPPKAAKPAKGAKPRAAAKKPATGKAAAKKPSTAKAAAKKPAKETAGSTMPSTEKAAAKKPSAARKSPPTRG